MRKILAIIILIAIALVASFFSFPMKGTVQSIHTGPTLELSEDLIIGQSFKSADKNLFSIDVYMTASKSKHKGDLILRLFESDRRGALLRTSRVVADKIRGDTYVRFPIKVLHNSAGRDLYFEIEEINVKPTDVRVWFYSDEHAYNDGMGYANEGPLNGDIQFRTYNYLGFYDWIGEFSARLAKGKVGPAGYPVFNLFLAMMILLVFAYLIAQIFDEQNNSAEPVEKPEHPRVRRSL